MADPPPRASTMPDLAVAIVAYLGFALSAGLSVRADGSTRWPAIAIGMLLTAVAAASLVVGARNGNRRS